MQVDLKGRSRWSPARRRASDGRSPTLSPRAGARVIYTDLDGAMRRRRPQAAPRPDEPHLSFGLDVGDGAEIDAVVARIAEASRPHRHPRQQRRHRRHGRRPQDHRRVPGRDLGRDAAHRPHRRVPGEPRRRPAHEGAESRAASSTSPPCSGSCRCGCRAPTSRPRPGS